MRLPGASCITSATRRILPQEHPNLSRPRSAGSQAGSKNFKILTIKLR
jgi:hypothetical protein